MFQSNHEGAIIDRIRWEFILTEQGIVINPGAYTRTAMPSGMLWQAWIFQRWEIHISDITSREEFRKISCDSTGM